MYMRHSTVIAGLDPAIPIASRDGFRVSGMPGTSPGMTD